MTSGESKTGLKNVYPSAKKLLPKVEEEAEAEDYCTPGAFELERLFWKGSPQYTHVNEVWPKLYIGDDQQEGKYPGYSQSDCKFPGRTGSPQQGNIEKSLLPLTTEAVL